MEGRGTPAKSTALNTLPLAAANLGFPWDGAPTPKNEESWTEKGKAPIQNCSM